MSMMKMTKRGERKRGEARENISALVRFPNQVQVPNRVGDLSSLLSNLLFLRLTLVSLFLNHSLSRDQACRQGVIANFNRTTQTSYCKMYVHQAKCGA